SGLRPPGAVPVDVPPAPRADSSREASEGRTLSAPEPSTAVTSSSSSQPEVPAAPCEPAPIPRTPSPASTATAANVMDIRSFAALKKSSGASRRQRSQERGAVEKSLQGRNKLAQGGTGVPDARRLCARWGG